MSGRTGEPGEVPAAEACPLAPREQKRNLLVFAACKGLIYLAAPVLYVGVTQAALCNQLQAGATVANLPATLYFAMWVSPLLAAWLVPQVKYLKRLLVSCYLAVAGVLAAMALVLLSPLPAAVKIGLVVLQGAVCGAALPTADALIWEVLGRGVAESRRGLTLALAFGAGPSLAALSSVGSQFLLSGRLGPLVLSNWGYPWNFAALFGLAAPAMLLAAWLAGRTVIPLPEKEAVRQPFVQGVFGGMWQFLCQPVLLTATLVTVLVYTGNNITANMNLYTAEVLDAAPSEYAGWQNFLRFSCKTAAGIGLGWLLTRSNPKASLLATGALFVAAMGWALVATGHLYLLAFGIYGAGELVGVYAPNYILSASRKADLRRNMALVNLMVVPAAPAGVLFGHIADQFGFRPSFALCAAFMLAGLLLAVLRLPARPTPDQEPLPRRNAD